VSQLGLGFKLVRKGTGKKKKRRKRKEGSERGRSIKPCRGRTIRKTQILKRGERKKSLQPKGPIETWGDSRRKRSTYWELNKGRSKSKRPVPSEDQARG